MIFWRHFPNDISINGHFNKWIKCKIQGQVTTLWLPFNYNRKSTNFSSTHVGICVMYATPLASVDVKDASSICTFNEQMWLIPKDKKGRIAWETLFKLQANNRQTRPYPKTKAIIGERRKRPLWPLGISQKLFLDWWISRKLLSNDCYGFPWTAFQVRKSDHCKKDKQTNKTNKQTKKQKTKNAKNYGSKNEWYRAIRFTLPWSHS